MSDVYLKGSGREIAGIARNRAESQRNRNSKDRVIAVIG
jgi:hypothetical protein